MITAKDFVFIIIVLFFLSPSVYTQEAKDREDFWISPSAEIAMYSHNGAAYGGGISLGYGSGSSIGFKAAFLFDANGLSVLEINLLFRWYFQGQTADSGPFIQFTGGPAFMSFDNASPKVPDDYATLSAGLNIGWRFHWGRFFLEPCIRAGYPYIAGAGLSAGLSL